MKKRENILAGLVLTATLATIFIIGPTMAQQAQQAGIKRTDLQQNDLSIPGKEVVQVRVDIGPGVVAAKHNHPGEEIVYMIEGVLEYKLEGKPAVTLKAGDVLFIPAGTPHTVINHTRNNAAELATYIVEKGKPLLTPVK